MMPAMPAAFTLLLGALKGVRAVVGDTARSFARHTHDEFGIGLIDRGAQRSASGRGPVEAWAGDVITVNPGEVHDGAALTPAGRRWRMLYLDVGVLRAWADDMGADGVRLAAEFTQPVLRDARLAAGFRQAFACVTGPTLPEQAPAQAMAAHEALLSLLGARLAFTQR